MRNEELGIFGSAGFMVKGDKPNGRAKRSSFNLAAPPRGRTLCAPTALPFMLETLRRVNFSFLIPNFLTPHFSFLI